LAINTRPRLVDPKSLHIHPSAHLVPDMRSGEWREFYADIWVHGIKVPLEVLADGTVLDGRHRLRAALELGMKSVPIVDASLDHETPVVCMLKAAVLRRHLSDDQRAAIAVLWMAENKQARAGPGRGHIGEKTSASRHASVVDTHGQSPWHFTIQAWLDALRAITHSPTGIARGTLPFGTIGERWSRRASAEQN